MSRRYLLIGSGIAALSAAEAIRESDAGARILLVSEEAHPFYSRPGLAYLLNRSVPERQLHIRSAAELNELDLERITGRVAALDPADHRVLLADGRSLGYDRLLLATGAASIAPTFPGADLQGVVRLDGLDDARNLLRLAKRGRTAVVVGGGSTALELVEGLHARGMHTRYFLRGDRYWSRVLDETESTIVAGRVQAAGVALHPNTEVRAALGKKGRLAAVETDAGEVLKCDLLAVAIGVRPRLELARGAGLRVDRGVLTTDLLQTSEPDVFAAGDVAQVGSLAGETGALDTLWASALAQGRVAGLNLAGGSTPYRKRVALNVTALAGVVTTIIGAVGGGADPDLLTLTRGQSERWRAQPGDWSLVARNGADRLRILVGKQTIEGAIVMGDQTLSYLLTDLIAERVDISLLRPHLAEHPERAIDLLLDFDRQRRAPPERPGRPASRPLRIPQPVGT
jgi:NAD(P)H-nitrite reductase large subunit